MEDMTITNIPRLTGFVIYQTGFSHAADGIDLEFIHPTEQAARDYIEEWYLPDDDDILICRIDSPLVEVARIKGSKTLAAEATQADDTPLFQDKP